MNKKSLKYFLEFSFIKSLYFNLFYFGIKGLKFPIILSKNVKLRVLKGEVKIKNFNTGKIKIGFTRIGILDSKYNKFIWENSGQINFRGKANLGSGVKLSNRGKIDIGDNFNITANTTIICCKEIEVGENVLISWENLIMDTDFHKIKDIKNDMLLNKDKKIFIGNNIWIGCRNTILKGTYIDDNSVISANNLITHSFKNKTNIIIGDKNKIIKEKIYWEV